MLGMGRSEGSPGGHGYSTEATRHVSDSIINAALAGHERRLAMDKRVQRGDIPPGTGWRPDLSGVVSRSKK